MSQPPAGANISPEPPATRRIIVNADDFGLSPGVNAGIALAHTRGILTSATLLANGPAFAGSVETARENPGLGVGLHLNLVRGRPLSPPGEIPLLVDAAGFLRPFRFRRMSPEFLAQAEREYRRQFEKVLAANLRPTHIDFEKHHAWQGPLYSLACALAAEYGIAAARTLREPVAWSLRRLGWPGGKRAWMAVALRCGAELFGSREAPLLTPDWFLGQCFIGGMTEQVWLRLVDRLPPGTFEVMTHPGLPDQEDGNDMGPSWINDAREMELNALLSAEVRRYAGEREVRFITFRDLLTVVSTSRRDLTT